MHDVSGWKNPQRTNSRGKVMLLFSISHAQNLHSGKCVPQNPRLLEVSLRAFTWEEMMNWLSGEYEPSSRETFVSVFWEDREGSEWKVFLRGEGEDQERNWVASPPFWSIEITCTCCPQVPEEAKPRLTAGRSKPKTQCFGELLAEESGERREWGAWCWVQVTERNVLATAYKRLRAEGSFCTPVLST